MLTRRINSERMIYMEPKFINRFKRTFEVEQELYKYLHITSPTSLACIIILILAIAVNLAMVLAVGLVYANLAVFAMGIIVLFVLLLRYYLAIQAGKKRFAEETNNKGEITITETLTDELLISDSTAREDPIEVPLSHLKKLFSTKNYHMIQTDERMIYAFKKDAFTVGAEAEFLAFVHQQIENNKRRKK